MQMFEELRRIVTGHNEKGKSVVYIDGPPGNQLATEAGGLFEIWNTEGDIVDSRSEADRAKDAVVLGPPAKGTKFRYFAMAPEDPSKSPEEVEAAAAFTFEMIGAAEDRVDTSRHAGMHKTRTIDYIILLKGENVSLMLEEDERPIKPFDVVVQRGTNHAWVNRGKEPALFIAVLIDAEIE